MRATPIRDAEAGHLPSLDGLRGLAIVLVLAHNLQLLQAPQGGLTRWLEFAMDRGWVGVQLFFVLSGFLITGILLDSRQAPNHFASFYARRALRILPLYYLALVVVLVVLPASGVTAHIPAGGWRGQWPFWVYLSNWASIWSDRPQYALAHFWSLAIEEQFYLVWPLVLARLDAARALRGCLALAAAAVALRVAMVLAGVDSETIYKTTFCRLDALCLGGAAAAALRVPGLARRGDDPSRLRRIPMLALALAGAGLLVTRGYPRGTPLGQTVGYAVLALCFAMVVGACAVADRRALAGPWRALRVAPLRLVGRYSYGLYVIHWPLHDLLGRPIVAALSARGVIAPENPLHSVLYVLGCGGASLLLAVLSFHAFEARWLGLKPRYAARPSSA